MSSVWSAEFLNYFNKHLQIDLSSGKWILQDQNLNIYEDRSGITNNPSESFNAILKRIFTSEVKAQIHISYVFIMKKKLFVDSVS
jgi:hypothetical protein